MVRQILPISALLLGSFFLLFAGGINGLILPVRGSAEGFTDLSLGLLGTGWAIGYVSGCLYTARLVQRVGHIRAFSVMCSLAGIVILAQLLILSPHAWIPLRALQGFCFAGAAMIVESWLSERADARSRGRIFGIYTMVNLFASTAGQLTLTVGDSSGYFFFVLGAMFYSLALIPTAASSSATPQPLVSVKLDIRALWRNSPVAVFAVFMVGISNASFGTLAAVYGARIGLEISSIALFASIPILIGAISQIPVGILSDRLDRRKVLVGVALVALIADVVFVLATPENRWANLALAGVFGGAIFAMYPIIIAHANDHADGNFIRISGGLLLVFGVGSIIGPLVAGWAMSVVGHRGLFLTTASAHVLIILQAIYRIVRRAPVADSEKSEFKAGPIGRTTTPQTIAMSASESEVDEAMEVPETSSGEAGVGRDQS
ncbi:MFS transporter [Silicimonas sp. MF1-12-2]|uniref:MFS transporter n=1 Tax=Silicimonas sp. MF1-12-2 TaxID=3384793 RepID=UPI0039B672E5